MKLTSLPDEVFGLVVQQLRSTQQASLRVACRQLREMVDQHQTQRWIRTGLTRDLSMVLGRFPQLTSLV